MSDSVIGLTLGTFGAADWAVVVVYFAGVLAVGAWAGQGQRDDHSFFLANRSMPPWAVAASVLATSLSAATFIGAPQLAYEGDLTYLILNIGGLLGAIVVAVVFIPAFYRAGTLTIYGYLGRRFGPAAMVASSVVFLLGRLLASGARLFIAGIAFCVMLFGRVDTGTLVSAIVVLGVVGTLYTVVGGIKAVIWTDVVQLFVVVGAALLSIWLLLELIPLSVVEIIETLHAREKLKIVDGKFDLSRPFTIWAGCAIVFLNTAAYGADHDLTQRMLTTRSALKSSLSLVAANIASIPVVCLFMVIGLLLSIFYGMPEVMGEAAPMDPLDDSRRIYPQFLVNHLPRGLAGLAMAGMLAAGMSSFDSAVNAMASTVVADLGPRRDGSGLGVSRIVVACVGLVLTLFAIAAVAMQQASGQTLIDFALGVMSFAYAGLLGVFLTALLTRRGNTTSVLAALVSGAAAVLLVQPYVFGPLSRYLAGESYHLAMPWWMVIGTTVSFAVCIWGAPSRRVG